MWSWPTKSPHRTKLLRILSTWVLELLDFGFSLVYCETLVFWLPEQKNSVFRIQRLGWGLSRCGVGLIRELCRLDLVWTGLLTGRDYSPDVGRVEFGRESS
jgi:hypothetical protein